MFELVVGIQAAQRLTRTRIETPDLPDRRRGPARRSRLAAARRTVSGAMVALTVPWPAPRTGLHARRGAARLRLPGERP